MPVEPRQRRLSFNRDPATYHDGRPPYPTRVYDLLTDRCGLVAGSRVLEVGAGSGTATSELLARGARVTAVEPGANLAALLRTRHPEDALTVVRADLEHAQLPERGFDLAVAATSWHWVDGSVGVPKVAAALRPGGALALWWTVFGDPDQPHTEFRDVLQPLYERFLPREVDDGQPPLPMRTEHWCQQLSAGGWFEPPAVEVIRWSQPLTPASARALWATFPNVAELSHPDRSSFLTGVAHAVIDRGGVVNDPRVTIVYHATRPSLAA